MTMTTIMGCAPSKVERRFSAGANDTAMKNEESVVQAYVRMDNLVNDVEKESPAPQLASVISMIAVAQEELIKYETLMETNGVQVIAQEDSLTQVMVDLKLSKNSPMVAEHEEFVANINRKEIVRFTKSLLEAKFNDLKEMKAKLEADVERLQALYKEQDLLLERVLGAQYGSVTERSIESDLTRLRALRDTLSVGARAWRAAAGAAVRAHSSAASALLSWQLISQTGNVTDRVRLGVETRNSLIRGIQEVKTAQTALPSAQFPHCTLRQLQALTLTLDYMFTDMYSEERYKHATRVFTGFSERTLSLAAWITEILKTSLDKDIYEISENIHRLTDELRAIRVNMIVEKGYGDVIYKRPSTL